MRRNPYDLARRRSDLEDEIEEYGTFVALVHDLWDDIDAAVTEAIEEHGVDRRPPGASSAFVDDFLGARLGGGYWGVVFATAYPRWVVKVTADPREGSVCQFVLDNAPLRDHPGCVRFLRVWQHEDEVKLGSAGRFPVHVILREAITPIPLLPLPVLNARRAREAWNMLGDLAADASFLMDDIESGDPAAIRKSEGYWRATMDAAMRYTILRPMINLMQALYAAGPVVLHDLTPNNVGVRTFDYGDFSAKQRKHGPKVWVAHDLGHASHDDRLSRAQIAKLPRLVRNPPIPLLPIRRRR